MSKIDNNLKKAYILSDSGLKIECLVYYRDLFFLPQAADDMSLFACFVRSNIFNGKS